MRRYKSLLLSSSIAMLAATAQGSLYAQASEDEDEARQQEIVVTGSYIAGTPEDAALPVDVIGSAELEEIGAPSINEILRNLPSTQGLIGETNQFDTRGGQGNEGATTINLRGLGSARTLVLLNGKRHVAAEGIGVDVGIMPISAVQRIEVLKDGAAALYGSDAIGGVVNFITRDDYEGIEVRGNFQHIQDSDGEFDIGAIAGWSNDRIKLMGAIEYGERSELNIKDRDWALRPFAENPQGGWSSIGNPGTIVDFTPFGFHADPHCVGLGGETGGVAGPFCRFQYTFFDNLIEETETLKMFGVASMDFGEQTVRIEAAMSDIDLPTWKTSPAYPPQTLLAPTNFILPNHPGRIAFFADNPAFGAMFSPLEPLVFWGRYTGVAGKFGQPETGRRLTKQKRFGISANGPLFDGAVNYDFSINYSERNRKTRGRDMFVERFAFALRGLGGPGCDPATGTPGVGACEYFNPFSNAIQTSAVNGVGYLDLVPGGTLVPNSPALLNWLTGEGTTYNTVQQTVADLVFSGDTIWELGGGQVGYAVGFQMRQNTFDLNISNNFNLNINPCPFTNPEAITQGFTASLSCAGAETGLFAFLSGTRPNHLERSVYGAFGELNLPFSDRLNVQLAARYEDYGNDNGGNTFDPKLAVKFQATDDLALRGSISTTFRGPDLSALLGRTTSLQFIAPTTAFKAVDTVGNPNLKPESALATNLGVLFSRGGFTGSLDYWRFDFEDPFQLESAGQIVARYQALGCDTVLTGDCAVLRPLIDPLGTAPNGITRVTRTVTNGSDITTDGLDFSAAYTWDLNTSELTLGTQGTYTLSYDSDDFFTNGGVFLASGGDFVGFLNEGTPFQTIVDLRMNAYARYERGPHTLTYNLRYVSGYDDAAPSIPALGSIDSNMTHDITYNLSLFDGKSRLSASVFNLLDEDPPHASTDLNYDPYTHSAFGRMIKVGFVHEF